MFGQTFDFRDLFIIAVLVVLEGVLSIDNALVLGLLARRLPKFLQRRALTYGLLGALAFRILAVVTAAWLLQWRWVKLIGGGYLLWVAVKHFAFDRAEGNPDEKLAVGPDGTPIRVDEKSGRPLSEEELDEELLTQTHGHGQWADFSHARSTHTMAFWMAVAAIELTDIAFAVDSIVAAIGVVGPGPGGAGAGGVKGGRHPKLWVIIIGGMLGVVLMRFAALLFIRLLERFPRFETSAYLLVAVIGAKLLADWFFNTPAHPDRLEMHDPGDIAFWLFWGLMLLCFLIGFLPKRRVEQAVQR